MTKNRSNSWILLIIAFFVSCLVWYMVVSHMDPDITLHLGNQDVILLKADGKETGFAYYIEDYSSVGISVDVPQLKAACLSVDDFRLTADVSECKEGVNTVQLDVNVLKNKSVIGGKFSLNHDQITVRAEKLVTKSVDVAIDVIGDLQDGLSHGDPILKHSTIQMRVPASLAEQEFSVVGTVDISKQTKTFTNQVALTLFNGLGEAVDCDSVQIYLNQKTMETTIPIGKKGSIKIKLPSASDYESEDYCCTSISGSFDTVNIIGSESVLSGLKKITITASDLDMETRTSTYSRKIFLQDYLPDKVYVMSDSQNTLTVDLEIEEIKNKLITLDTKQIVLTGLDKSLTSTLLSPAVTVTLRGRKTELENISGDDLELKVSLASLEKGEYEITPVVSFKKDASGGNCRVMACTKIRVKVSGS